jgi:hypothetical protein
MFHLWGLDINHESVTVRRLWNFFDRLPASSETMSDILELTKEERTWSPEMYMQANIIDCIQALDWHFVAANSKNKPKPPKPIQRPEGKARQVTKKKLWPGKTIVDRGTK